MTLTTAPPSVLRAAADPRRDAPAHLPAVPAAGSGLGHLAQAASGPVTWAAAAVMVLSTGAGLAVVEGPTGLVGNFLWLLVYGVVGLLLLDRVLRLRAGAPWSPWSACYVAVALASVLWSEAPAVTVQAAVGLVGTLVVAQYLAQRLSPLGVLDAARVAMTAVALASLALYLSGDGRALDPTHGTLRGVLVAKNSLGQAMAVGLVVTALAWSRDPRRWKPRLASALPMTAALLLTDSATGVLIAALGVVVAVAVRLLSAHRLVLPAVGCLCVAAAVAAWTVGQGLRLSEAFGAVGRDTTLTGRTEIWPASLEAVLAHPLLGYGYGAFWNASGASEDIRVRLGFSVAHAHNGLLDVALETGVLGVAVALAVLAGLAAAAWRDVLTGRGDVATLRLGVLGLVVAANSVESGLLNENNLLTILLFTALAVPPAPRAPGCRARHERRGALQRRRRSAAARRLAGAT